MPVTHLHLPPPGPLLLAGARRPGVLPNMALVFRVERAVSAQELTAEATRLAGSVFGLGRTLHTPRVPAARPRWLPDTGVPPIDVVSGLGGAELQRWLDGRVSRPVDPTRGTGWQLDAYVCPGGPSWVALTMSHLYGTGRDFIAAAFGDACAPDPTPGTEPAGLFTELHDVAVRLGDGLRGVGRLAGSVRQSVRSRGASGELVDLQRVALSGRHRDPTRGRPSARRVTGLARVSAASWTAAAESRGGTPGVLQNAVVANLVRQARTARGAESTRPVRVIVPVDLADRDAPARADATVAPVELTSACLTVRGGPPDHGDLSELRVQLKQAYADAMDEVARTGRVQVAPGVVDAMRLLPDSLSARAMFAVHGTYDGASSLVGRVPPGLLRIAGTPASAVFLLAYPLGSDLSVCSGTDGRDVFLSVVADPSRLGAGPSLTERLHDELAGWGLQVRS